MNGANLILIPACDSALLTIPKLSNRKLSHRQADEMTWPKITHLESSQSSLHSWAGSRMCAASASCTTSPRGRNTHPGLRSTLTSSRALPLHQAQKEPSHRCSTGGRGSGPGSVISLCSYAKHTLAGPFEKKSTFLIMYFTRKPESKVPSDSLQRDRLLVETESEDILKGSGKHMQVFEWERSSCDVSKLGPTKPLHPCKAAVCELAELFQKAEQRENHNSLLPHQAARL